MTTQAPLDVRRILLALKDHGVRFIVIGGVAALLQDVPLPPTLDLDVTVEDSKANLKRLGETLREIEATLRAPGLDEGFPIPLDEHTLDHVQFMTFLTKYGPFDVTVRPDGTHGYKDLRRGAVEIGRFGILILVSSVEDIIRSKEAANREKDVPHLVILHEFLRDRTT